MIALKTLIDRLQPSQIIGLQDRMIANPIPLDPDNESDTILMWGAEKMYATYSKVKHGVLICNRIEPEDIQEGVTYIIVEKPRKSFLEYLKMVQPQPKKGIISSSASIAEGVNVGASCTIGDFVVIEEGCTIGDHVFIDHHSVIKRNTVIENHVKIGANNVIGGVGFGYERNDEGAYELLPHIGNVHIKSGVEIGNNNCIDRAVMGSTILRENVKVDNLVHIAHGVDIGKNSLIIANAMVAGSVTIGENVWVAPSSSILNKIQLGSNAVIGMGAVVLKTIDDNAVVVGNPGKTIKYIKE